MPQGVCVALGSVATQGRHANARVPGTCPATQGPERGESHLGSFHSCLGRFLKAQGAKKRTETADLEAEKMYRGGSGSPSAPEAETGPTQRRRKAWVDMDLIRAGPRAMRLGPHQPPWPARPVLQSNRGSIPAYSQGGPGGGQVVQTLQGREGRSISRKKQPRGRGSPQKTGSGQCSPDLLGVEAAGCGRA